VAAGARQTAVERFAWQISADSAYRSYTELVVRKTRGAQRVSA
jgi:hypothetical protein